MDNSTLASFDRKEVNESEPEYNQLTSIVRLILCFTCVTAVIVNLKVFACIYWIRRPLNSILKISLSLALADSCASCLSAVSIFSEDAITYRTFIILDLIRLCFILVTVFHLLGLGFNHYIGIRKPLHHNSRLDQKGGISGLLVLLWLVPTIFTIVLYTVEGGTTFWQAMIEDNLIETNYTIRTFNSLLQENLTSPQLNDSFTIIETNHTILYYRNGTFSHVKFLETFRFRMTIGSFIVICMFLIVLCYICILFMIRRQRKVWKDLSRTGSTVWKGHNCRYTSKEKSHEQNKIKGNFRAVYTTLFILGSCFIGWLPALLLYTLTCSQDCFISGSLLEEFNEKYRWHIEGTKQMHIGIIRHLCGRRCRNNQDHYSKTNNSTHSHVALTSFKSDRSDKGNLGRNRKNRQSSQTSYL